MVEGDGGRRELRRILTEASELDFQPGEAAEFLLWRDSLETDNFSLEEICTIVNIHAQQLGIDGFALRPEDVTARVADRARQPRQKPKGLASIVVEMCEQAVPPVRITKPELAMMLARQALEHPLRDDTRRGILGLAEHRCAARLCSQAEAAV